MDGAIGRKCPFGAPGTRTRGGCRRCRWRPLPGCSPPCERFPMPGIMGGHWRRRQTVAQIRQHLGEEALYTDIHTGAIARSATSLIDSPSSGMLTQLPPGGAPTHDT
jgi:hypothetical protein